MIDDNARREVTDPFAMLPEDCVLAPAASAQRGLWITQELDPTSPAYLIAHVFKICGELLVPALSSALDGLVARHETLRTSFLGFGDEIHQVIHAAVPPVLRIADAEDDRAVASAVERETATPFDLARPPLLRALLLRIDAVQHVLVIVLHHIVVEGVSVELLWDDLAVLYRSARDGGQAQLPELPLQYADFAAWEDAWLKTHDYQEQLDFWRRQLAGAPSAIDLPAAVSGTGPSWRGETHALHLSEEETTAAVELARRHQVTPFMVLLVVLSGVLHRWSGQPDVIVGTPVTLRDQPGLEGVVGVLINSVPLRLTWSDDPTGAVALDRARTVTGEAFARKRIPFDHLVTALPGLRQPGRNPIMQVMFAYQGEREAAESGLRLVGTSASRIEGCADTAKFDLSVDCVLSEGQLLCVFGWSNQRLDRKLAELLSEHFIAALRHLIARADARVGEWPLAANEPRASSWLAGFVGDGQVSWTNPAAKENGNEPR